MNCQVCNVSSKKKISLCAQCSTGFYCSTDCQCKDWPTHKHICNLWVKATGHVYNPWFSHKELTPTFSMRGKACPVDMLAQCTETNPLKLTTTFGTHFETPLHAAIICGEPAENVIGRIHSLLRAGVYIDSVDSHGGTPLYYACNHPKVTQGRLEIVTALVKLGANTLHLSHFSGLRPAEAAHKSGYQEVSDFITSCREKEIIVSMRDRLNDKNASAEVRLFLDLTWRVSTLQWYTYGISNNITPHPQVHINNEDDFSRVMIDCQRRHEYWWNKVTISVQSTQ